MGYRHRRQVVVCDRRACGKETQRASEVALQFATETLNTLAQHARTHAHTHSHRISQVLVICSTLQCVSNRILVNFMMYS